MNKPSANEPKLGRNDWLERSLEVLRDEGIVGVRVERLARDLDVTKGSFYWHFKDRDDLFDSMLQYWCEQYNDAIMKNDEILTVDPAEGMLIAMKRIREEGLDQYELAMRSWADHDEKIDRVVRQVYEQRKQFIGSFFKRMGFRGIEAESRIRLIVCYLSWEPNMFQTDSESKRFAVLESLHKLLTKR